MKNVFLLMCCLLFITSVNSQSVLGVWKTIDDTDNIEKSHIEIYEENGKVHGRVIKLLEGATMSHCDDCSGDRKDKPIEGMVILSNMVKDGDYYTGGEIFDPAKDNSYSCDIKLEEADKLYVRGYIGFSLLGRTQYWYRVQ